MIEVTGSYCSYKFCSVYNYTITFDFDLKHCPLLNNMNITGLVEFTKELLDCRLFMYETTMH